MGDLRGFGADASVALLVVFVLGLCLAIGRGWGKALGLLVAISWLLVSFGMYEFISVFDSLYALSHAGFLADSTFVGGSVRHARHPMLLGSLALIALAATTWAGVPRGRWWRWWGLAFALSVFVQVFIPATHSQDEWRQRNAVEAHLAILGSSAGLGSGAISAEVRDAFRGDLRGQAWVPPLEERPNLLLVMIEGASGAYLPSVAAAEGVDSETRMPKLDALAKDQILFSRVIAQQRQTNRGEYGILCGDYPKLLTDQSKMSEQVYAAARRCLPEVLREQGYATSYIQSAPLGFMLKDQFMERAGFEELIGDRWFEQSYARSDWGVDDKAFFEQSLERVVELHAEDKPFFATLLTVGTHHPFTIPDAAVAEGARRRRQRAFRWADDALAEFLGELERRGVLQDTVVVITSDESAGLSKAANAMQGLLSQSWSFAVVLLPSAQTRRVDTLQAHVDTALSITDLLGLGTQGRGFIGRSWFREYETPRRLFAGNTYARRVIMWEPSGAAVVCPESLRNCKRSTPIGDLVFGPERQTEPATPREQRLLTEIARLTKSGRRDMSGAPGLDLLTADRISLAAADGKKLLAGGQYLRVPGGTRLRVDLDLEVSGDQASIDFHHDVFIDGYEKFGRKKVRIRAGERWRLSYALGVSRNSSQLVVQLYATTTEGEVAEVRIRDARLSMQPEAEISNYALIIEDEVSRSDLR